jgi:hypothetical protein
LNAVAGDLCEESNECISVSGVDVQFARFVGDADDENPVFKFPTFVIRPQLCPCFQVAVNSGIVR